MKMVRVGGMRCVRCDAVLDGATPALVEAQPMAGDLTICFYCGEIYEFTVNPLYPSGVGMKHVPFEQIPKDGEHYPDLVRLRQSVLEKRN